MGFISLFLIILFLVHVVSSSTTSTTLPSSSPSSSTHEVKLTHRGSADVEAVQYRLFYIKNTTPFYNVDRVKRSTNRVVPTSSKNIKRKNIKKKTTMMMRRKKIKNFETTSRPFSVMLPKGFVPPSGSSPCHNENPNSVVFFCQLAASPKP